MLIGNTTAPSTARKTLPAEGAGAPEPSELAAPMKHPPTLPAPAAALEEDSVAAGTVTEAGADFTLSSPEASTAASA
jgi:hypothetical protein